MRSLLSRLRREDGIALPVVMGALVVTANPPATVRPIYLSTLVTDPRP